MTLVSPSTTGNFDRNSTLTFNGTGLAYFTRIEIVDSTGNDITSVTALGQTTLGTGGSFGATSIVVATDAFTQGNLLDSVTALNRRVKVPNPVGSVVSDNNSSGAFTVSAEPTFGTVQQTFAGGGYDGSTGNGTYDLSVGNLYINASNLRGVKTITFNNGTADVSSVSVSAAAPPAGYTFSADGTQIIITSAVIPGGWAATTGAATGNRTIRLTTAADRNATTGSITTQP